MVKWAGCAEWKTYDFALGNVAYKDSLFGLELHEELDEHTVLIKRESMAIPARNLESFVRRGGINIESSKNSGYRWDYRMGGLVVSVGYLPSGLRKGEYDSVPGALMIDQARLGADKSVNSELINLADHLELFIPFEVQAEYLEKFQEHLSDILGGVEGSFPAVSPNGRRGSDIWMEEQKIIQAYEKSARQRGARKAIDIPMPVERRIHLKQRDRGLPKCVSTLRWEDFPILLERRAAFASSR